MWKSNRFNILQSVGTPAKKIAGVFVNICFMWVHYSSVNKNAMYKKMKVFKRYLDAGLFPENYYNKIIH